MTDVCHVLPGKLGGVVSIVANLLQFRQRGAGLHSVVLTHNSLETDARFESHLDADTQTRFDYTLPVENVRSVLRRLARVVPAGPGVLVAHDWIELGMIECHPTERAVLQVLHGDHDYYYNLAVKHEPVIDAYIAYSRTMHENLLCRLPHRRETIFHLPYGIPLTAPLRSRVPGPLRLVFAGRLENGQKGIFDLPLIDRQLQEQDVPVCWTLVGEGPDGDELLRRWGAPGHVRRLGRKSNAEVLQLCAEHDVFVLPTRAEGFPVALLEAMSAGLVPVVSNIPSGVPEIVTDGVTGFCPPVGDIAGYTAGIVALARDRDRLEIMSRAARATVQDRFDIRERVKDYEALFARWRELRRPRQPGIRCHYGSRLDQPWLPNPLVYTLRAGHRLLRGKHI